MFYAMKRQDLEKKLIDLIKQSNIQPELKNVIISNIAKFSDTNLRILEQKLNKPTMYKLADLKSQTILDKILTKARWD